MGKRKRQWRRRSHRRRPLYKCMVKMAMACLKHKPGATRQEIERKVMNIYKKRGLDDFKHEKAVKHALRSLVKARCVHKRGSQYQIEPQCARDALSVHKRRRRKRRKKRRSRSRSRSGSQSGSRSQSHSQSKSRIPQFYTQRKPQRTNRRKRKRHRRQNGQTTPTICHLSVSPRVCPANPCLTNQVCRFPLRDAMIIAMTIFFSYWMQRTASHMQFTAPEIPNVPIQFN